MWKEIDTGHFATQPGYHIPLSEELITHSLEENPSLFLSNKLRKIILKNLRVSKKVCPSAYSVPAIFKEAALSSQLAWGWTSPKRL